MADLRKFLDRAGVSTLWGAVVEKLAAEQTRAEAAEKANAAAAKAADDKAVAAQNAVDALNTKVGEIKAVGDVTPATVIAYVDEKTKGIATDAALGALQATVDDLTTDVDNLKQIDHTLYAEKTQVAQDIATALTTAAQDATTKANAAEANAVNTILGYIADEEVNTDFDTLKEIAAWIESDTTGAAGMANDIAELKTKVGEKGVATQIQEAIEAENLAQYTTATELAEALEAYVLDTELATEIAKLATAEALQSAVNRIAALEDIEHSDFALKTQVATDIAAAKGEAIADAEGKIATAKSEAIAAAKTYSDGLATNYATAAQGTKADGAVQSITFAENSEGIMQATVDDGGVTTTHNLFATLTAAELQAIIDGTATA